MSKRRLDVLLVDRGLAESREKAQALVMAGQVTVDERPAPKPGVLVREDAAVAVAAGQRYVSRGGEKLERALEAFRLDVTGLVAADIGASTGGFTDCLLQHGASKIYAIDVGRGQLDYRFRNDPRVVVMEGVNARELTPLPEPVDFVTIDVSFISLRLILPTVVRLLDERTPLHPTAPLNKRESSGGHAQTPGMALRALHLGSSPYAFRAAESGSAASGRGSIVALFKPQFEAMKEEVPRGGVIRDPLMHSQLIGRFAAWCVTNGFGIRDMVSSPILGDAGNREFLFWLAPAPAPVPGAASSAPTGGRV
jgi:23S rRNA (cytidine1920-2'-O)/16S rRNA (cytidine1409-2'-O)-methyltransferase